MPAVKAVYRPAATTREWLQRVAEATALSFDRGFGVAAIVVDMTNGVPETLDIAQTAGCPDARSLAPAMNRRISVAQARRLYFGSRRVNSAVRLLGRVFEDDVDVRAGLHPLGIRDVIGLIASDGSPRLVSVCIPSAKKLDFSLEDERRLSRLAGHLSAGLRLRRQPDDDAVDAVVSAEGEVEHAEGDARARSSLDRLRAHALAIERAGHQRSADSIDLWKVLADATWSLVETFDRDGRRYYLARQNAVAGAGPAALAPREREVLALPAVGHSNKLIAYELGISSTSVSTLVRSAMTKLGVERRADLGRLLAVAPPPAP